jgi:hypothetical protein
MKANRNESNIVNVPFFKEEIKEDSIFLQILFQALLGMQLFLKHLRLNVKVKFLTQ